MLQGGNGGSDWTPEREEFLRRDWAAGRTAREIANRLGGVSRCAVIGKARRMKLPHRAEHGWRSAHGKSRLGGIVQVRAPRILVGTSSPSVLEKKVLGESLKKGAGAFLYENRYWRQSKEPELDTPVEQRKKLEDLEPSDCRWPHSDPDKPDFGFCGRKAVPGLPYCEAHRRVAYVPVDARGRAVRRHDAKPFILKTLETV